jgi:uncharacterized spore protein YtfJ
LLLMPMAKASIWRRSGTERRPGEVYARNMASMNPQDVLTAARDALTVKRVFAEPYEKDGATVVAVAKVQGGGGGGGGEGPSGEGSGSGGGFGVNARPVGMYLIRGDELIWRPAVDVNRVVLGAQVVAVVALLTARSIVKSRAKARERVSPDF